MPGKLSKQQGFDIMPGIAARLTTMARCDPEPSKILSFDLMRKFYVSTFHHHHKEINCGHLAFSLVVYPGLYKNDSFLISIGGRLIVRFRARGAPASRLSPHPSSVRKLANGPSDIRSRRPAMGPPDDPANVGVKSSHFVTVNKIFNLTEKRKKSMIRGRKLKNIFPLSAAMAFIIFKVEGKNILI
jgi:hypothetical protein